MTDWRLGGPPEALSLVPEPARRVFGDEAATWASVMYARLAPVEVFVLYFPSRFDLPVDKSCTDLLRAFGQNTSEKTSVNFWDPKDTNFETALGFFDLKSPPAVVLASGLQLRGVDPQGPNDSNLYSISFADKATLTDQERFVQAVNLAQEVLLKGDPAEIRSLVRKQNLQDLLAAIGHIAAAVRDQLIKLKPTIGVPGGPSIGIG
jgi:hypothetical protein